MSLIKQLWLTIAALLLLAFVGSLVVGISAGRHYIEQEIRIKNSDNANALALSMSQLEKDPVILELLLAAQFDTGHYRHIELRDTAGQLIEGRAAADFTPGVPDWFIRLIDFEVAPGTAVVQQGWQQFGTLSLQSQHGFAYRTLWRHTLSLAGWFALAGLASLLLAALVVRRIRRPLHDVVAQAQAIGERRFITSPEPRTRELRQVVQAMNRLSQAVRGMLDSESEQLDRLRRRLEHDPLTDVLGRAPFLARLDAYLHSRGHDASGLLAIVRVGGLARLNQRLGHPATDVLLVALARALEQLGAQQGDSCVARLNGSDFALLLPHAHDSQQLSESLQAVLQPLMAQYAEADLALPAALLEYHPERSRPALLARLDDLLASAEAVQESPQVMLETTELRPLFTSHAAWRQALEHALQGDIRLARHPVLAAQGELLHYEAPSRLRLRDEWRNAAVFLPWIARLEMASQLDLAVVRVALAEVSADATPLSITLAPHSLRDGRFVHTLSALLREQPDAARRLWFDVPEVAARHHPEAFRSLGEALLALGCRVGLKQVTPRFGQIDSIHGLGLHYLKINAPLSQSLDHDPQQQSLLRGLATLAHSLGMLAIAEGVTDPAQAQQLFELGLDGVTGPGI